MLGLDGGYRQLAQASMLSVEMKEGWVSKHHQLHWCQGTKSTIPLATPKVHKLKRDEGTLLSGQEPEKSMTQGPQHLLHQKTEKAIPLHPHTQVPPWRISQMWWWKWETEPFFFQIILIHETELILKRLYELKDHRPVILTGDLPIVIFSFTTDRIKDLWRPPYYLYII